MKIRVNGTDRDVPAGTSVKALVELEGMGSGPVAVERNGDVVRRKDHADTVLAENDEVEIVHFVGGG
jgi:sulfur carrier protein